MGGKGSGRPGGVPKSQNPVKQAADPANVDREVNSRVMAFGRELIKFEAPDFASAESVEDAFMRYLEMCERHGIRPMVTSMANAFGMHRNELYYIAVDDKRTVNWRNGILTPESRCAVKKCYDFLNTAWESYLMDEKGNPVKWLFLGKNYFGMKDQSEQVHVKVDATRDLPAPDEVTDKYAKMVGKPRPQLEEVDSEVSDA